MGEGEKGEAEEELSRAATVDGSLRVELSEAPTMDAPSGTYKKAPTDRAHAPAAAALGAPRGARYRIVEEIGRGGMGRVLLAEDGRLGRRVAIKTRLSDRDTERAKLRFVEEARATAQLEHPNIVPVYDLDEDDLGQPRFSMRLVEGESLASVIARLRARDEEMLRLYPPAERIFVFLKVCDAVAYAHSRGVLHRDIKPENVMLGRFGEVFVMDWGLARVGESGVESAATATSVSSVRDSGVKLTVDGSIMGTPGYMAPEQARGDTRAIDAQSDVWALGALLYELLTLAPAVDGQNVASLMANTILGKITPPRERSPDAGVTAGMELVLMRALAVPKEARYESAVALRDAVSHELEGSREAERRRLAAETKHAAARGHLMRHADLSELHGVQRERAEAGLAATPTDVEHLEARKKLFEAQAEADQTGADARRAFWDAYGSLVGAVEEDHGFEPARAALIRLLLGRAEGAKSRGDQQTARDFEAIARQHDPVRVSGLLDAPATVEVVTRPAGAHVRISRFVEQGPLLVEEPTGELVKTPAAIELAPGSYVLDITHPERPPIRATVLLGSGERLTRDVWIPAEGVVADGFCYVPGGEYWIGGDELAPGFAPREKVTIAPFALGRLLVTVGQYAEFLNHLMKDEAPARAAGHAPAVASSAYWVPHRGEYPVPFVDPDGDTWLSDMPIIMMKATDADAFAEWSNRRLPRSAEWEIAVSGGDGRAFPWGNGFDAACSWMVDSCAGLGPRPVGTRPLDRSIFGVMDAAGLAREWMAPEPTYELRIVRGGAFQATANQCRIGRKNLAGPGVAYVTFGIRLAQDLDLVFRSEARRYPLGRE